ncbi:13184_t:CDS:2, partial [Ambispora gerdemannii]
SLCKANNNSQMIFPSPYIPSESTNHQQQYYHHPNCNGVSNNSPLQQRQPSLILQQDQQHPYHHNHHIQSTMLASSYRQNTTSLLSQQHHHPHPNQRQHLNIPPPPTLTHSQTPNRRLAHILSEQKRRENINSGFEELKNIVPMCRGHGDSKAVILRKAVRYIQNLEFELEKLRQQSGSLSPKTGSDSDASSDLSIKSLSNGVSAIADNPGRNSYAIATINGSPVTTTKNKTSSVSTEKSELSTTTATTHFYNQSKKASIERNYQNASDTRSTTLVPTGNNGSSSPPPSPNDKHESSYNRRHQPYYHRNHAQNKYASCASLHTPSPISSAISSDEEQNYKNEDIEWKRSISPISNHEEDYSKPRPTEQMYPPLPQTAASSSSMNTILVKQEDHHVNRGFRMTTA